MAQLQKIVNKVLILQKKSICILVDLKFKDPVRDYFKELVMFTDYSLYAFETVKCIKSLQLSCTKTKH